VRQRSLQADIRITRIAAICVVLGVHAFAILLLLGVRHEKNPAGEEKYVVWLPLAEDEQQVESVAIVPELSSEIRQQVQVPVPAILIPSSSSSTRVEPDSHPSWHDQGSFYARKAVEEATLERYRNLGARKPLSSPDPEAPALFEQEKPAFGETAEDAMGEPIVKLSKNCYRELAGTVNTAKDYVEMASAAKLAPPLVKCMFKAGSPEPRGDLFEHLKKERPLPEVKAATNSAKSSESGGGG
jgi:hypothetical protein